MPQNKDSELISLIRRVTSILKKLDIPHHLTGGIISSYYGIPRYTQDIDIVVQVSTDDADKIINALKTDFFINPAAIIDSIKCKRMFQALDNETCIKVDFHVGQAIPQELERSKSIMIFENLTVNIASIEDAIASKLKWVNQGSLRSKDDIIGMLSSEHEIDFNLLRELAKEIKATDLLENLLSQS